MARCLRRFSRLAFWIPFAATSVVIAPLSVHAQDTPDGQFRPSAWRDHYSSQRIEALRQQLASGAPSTEAFWVQVAREGTPIVEPSQPDDDHQLVTFLWRGTPETKNVLVVWSPFTGVRPQDYLMTRLEDSDVWYLVARVLRGARFLYLLSPNDPLDSRALGVWGGRRSPRADPLNPHQLAGQSVAELPGAPPQPWIVRHPETARGTVEEHQVTSELLGTERAISVYTPVGYHAAQAPYHMLVLLDKAIYESFVSVPTILDTLIAASRIPPTVAVLVSNSGTRGADLLFNETFVDFIATELIPWTGTRYNVTLDPSKVVIGGGECRRGYRAAHRPALFRRLWERSEPVRWVPPLSRAA